MKKQYIKALIEKATDSGFSFIASTAAIDRQGDSIDQAGWDLSNFKQNPVMLWAHDYSAPPVAKALTLDATDPRGLVGTCEFAPTDFAQQIKTLVEGGFVNALSVGFIPLQRNGNIITKSELLEISFVPVPANQEALILAAKSLTDKGFASDIVEKFLTLKEGENLDIVLEPAEAKAEVKGPVADEISAEENYEAKWANMDQFFDIVGAVCDVYFDENTPVEAFGSILAEAAGLITALANANTGDEEQTITMSAFSKLVSKSVGIDSKKALATLIEKVGARHSATTKASLQEAKDHADAISTVLGAMLDASTEGGTDAEVDDSEPKEQDDEKGLDAARALLEVRGVLRERAGTDTIALTIINRHLAGK